jgi:hypothetical protein
VKPRLTIVGSAAICLVTIGLVAVQGRTASDAGRDDDQSRIRRGYEIAPVPLNLHGKDRALVGLGSYIVNAIGGCNDCHTDPSFAPGGDPTLGQPKKINAAGYLAGGRDFGPGPFGEIVSKNLTPDANGLPAGLTFKQFRTVIRTGMDPDAGHPLIVMPWPVYQDMTDRDLRAIYEFLSAIPSIPSADPTASR